MSTFTRIAAGRPRTFLSGALWFSCARLRLLQHTADSHVAQACRNTPCRDRSGFAASVGITDYARRARTPRAFCIDSVWRSYAGCPRPFARVGECGPAPKHRPTAWFTFPLPRVLVTGSRPPLRAGWRLWADAEGTANTVIHILPAEVLVTHCRQLEPRISQ